MSATGTWILPIRGFEMRMAELRDWRRSTSEALAAFRRWALVVRMIDDHTATRLAHLERRIVTERLTIAFVAEFSRGKSELINALFFADLGTRLLPAGMGQTTLCPTEILWDPARPPTLRLLPIETRDSPKALREFMAEPESWKEIALDPSKPQEVAAACQSLSESVTMSGAEAANLGLEVESSARVEVPRWRYAVLNFPHPLLASGLAILDTPGHNTFGAEPELTIHRVPDAAGIVFMLAVDSGVTRSDHDLWVEHIAPIDGLEQTCFIVLNKIDGLRDGLKSEGDVLSDIDKQVRSTADSLGVDPRRIYALSARQGLIAKIQGDRDGLIRSRLYRLEQALSQRMVHQRRLDHAAAVRAETRSIFAESRALVDSRYGYAKEQLDGLLALQGKNQKLVESLARKAALERQRIEQMRAVVMGSRASHNRHADELARVLSPNAARDRGIIARKAVLATTFSKGIGEALDRFFEESRTGIRAAIVSIGEERALMQSVSRRFTQDYGLQNVDVPDFATERFLVELDRLEERCTRDFKGTTSLLTRGRKTLGALFFDSVALKVVHVFEIADREVRTWMNAFIRPLDAQLNAFQEQTNSRIEGMGRIQNAETDLVARLAELQELVDEYAGEREALEGHRETLAALLDVEREQSLV